MSNKFFIPYLTSKNLFEMLFLCHVLDSMHAYVLQRVCQAMTYFPPQTDCIFFSHCWYCMHSPHIPNLELCPTQVSCKVTDLRITFQIFWAKITMGFFRIDFSSLLVNGLCSSSFQIHLTKICFVDEILHSEKKIMF